MSEEFSQGNFEFVKKMYKDPKILEDLQNAEKTCKTNYKESGQALRDFMEALCRSLIEEYHITVDASEGKNPNLNDKIKKLNERNKLYKNNVDKCKGYKVNGGGKQNRKVPWFDYIRGLGNSCKHDYDKKNLSNSEKWAPAPNYPNVLLGLQRAHEVMKQEYRRISKKDDSLKDIEIKDFDEDIMPIGDEYIMSSYEPIDKDVSHCEKEYITCQLNDRKKPESYSIVRVYDKQGAIKLLMTREKDAFTEAMKASGVSFDGDVVDMDIISRHLNANSPFYIVQYKFYLKPKQLTDETLENLDILGRKELCVELAKIMNQFHNSSTPIYHRNLSFDCVYICENKEGIDIPCIIKLDCAKIKSPDYGEKKTAVGNVKKYQKEKKLEQSIKKYRDPQLNEIINNPSYNINWEKADIYSLGVLFGDILYGSTMLVRPVSGYQLKELDPDLAALADIVDMMRDPDPEKRPDTKKVVSMLEGRR